MCRSTFSTVRIALARISVTAERTKLRVVPIDFSLTRAQEYVSPVLAMTMRCDDIIGKLALLHVTVAGNT